MGKNKKKLGYFALEESNIWNFCFKSKKISKFMWFS